MDVEPEPPKAPRAGRRAGRRAAAAQEDAGADMEGGAGDADLPKGTPGGWGAENVKIGDDDGEKFTGVSRRKAQQMEQEAEEDKTSGMRNRRKHEQAADEPETILEIPELEAEGDEDITFQVAEAPRARNNRMQTMAELDNDQQFNLPSNTDNEVDLSLLTMVLCSSEQVVEDDNVWEPEILFTDVASELTIEAERLENDDEEITHNT